MPKFELDTSGKAYVPISETTLEARYWALWLVLESMLKWEAQAFEDDEEVDGGDLVEVFAQWRTQLRDALESAPGFRAFDKGYQVGFADGAEEEGDGALKFTKRESNTILAALRFYQQAGMGDPLNRSDEIQEIATDGDLISMDDVGIDSLCERINGGGTAR